jgi:apolipoprotein N-acyltransferase
MSTKDAEGAAVALPAVGKAKATEKLVALPWLLAGVSGALGALSMPGSGLDFLIWFALAPLFYALQGHRPRRAFQISLVAGACFFGVLFYWLYTLWDWASFFIIPGYLLLIGYLALYWGAFGAVYAWLSRRLPHWAMIAAAPALWIILEFIRALGPFGFTWGQLAQALYREIPVIQLASLTGIWGVSFLVVLINYLLYLSITRRRWRYLALVVVAVGLAWGWGMVHAEQPLIDQQTLRVALVQPNIPQIMRSDPSRLSEFLEKYQGLLAQIQPGSADMTILPESILPDFVLRDQLLLGYFESWARDHQSSLIFGSLDSRPRGYYNTAALLSAQGDLLGTYDKVQLVPFSTEYFPGVDFLDRLGLWRWLPIGRLGALTPGDGFHPIQAPQGKIGLSICFESIFPQIGRALVRQGAELLVTITNDAWFKETWALPQHLAQGVFRAVETDRYFVQAANTGLSAIVDPHGRILMSSSIAQAELVRGTVGLRETKTLYVRYGDWFIYLALGILAFSLLITRLRARS